jgi:hypothetical protein
LPIASEGTVMLGKEVLEKHFIESWKKEAGSEEDAARTISISLTVLGLGGVLLTLQKEAYGQIPVDYWIIVPLAFLVVFLTFSSLCILKILDAVRPASYGHHPIEARMIEFAEWEAWRLEVNEGLSGDELKTAVETLYRGTTSQPMPR